MTLSVVATARRSRPPALLEGELRRLRIASGHAAGHLYAPDPTVRGRKRQRAAGTDARSGSWNSRTAGTVAGGLDGLTCP